MIVLDGAKLRAYWDSIADGFSRSPIEVVLSVALLVVIFTLVVVLLLLRQKRERRKARDRELKWFAGFADRHGLTDSDREVLMDMCQYAPGKHRDIYSLVKNSALYTSCARKMLDAGDVSISKISRLRFRLGMTSKKGLLNSTVELEEGVPMTVLARDGSSSQAWVKAVSENEIDLLSSYHAKKGQDLELRVGRNTGLYSVAVKVSKIGQGVFSVYHSERVKRIQKRKYFRKLARGTVFIRIPGGLTRARLYDISGGGARIGVPDGDWKPDQSLKMALSPSPQEFFQAKIIRIPSDRKTMSVQFTGVKETTRERIIKSVMSGSRS